MMVKTVIKALMENGRVRLHIAFAAQLLIVLALASGVAFHEQLADAIGSPHWHMRWTFMLTTPLGMMGLARWFVVFYVPGLKDYGPTTPRR